MDNSLLIFYSTARKPRARASKQTVIGMLETKYEKKAALKEQELKQRAAEFEFQKKKYEDEEDKRKLELEERRLFLNMFQKKMEEQ